MTIPCPRCHGTDEIHCRICKGVGYVDDRQGDVSDADDTCLECGDYLDNDGNCTTCDVQKRDLSIRYFDDKDDDHV
jgi:hypothetical protein